MHGVTSRTAQLPATAMARATQMEERLARWSVPERIAASSDLPAAPLAVPALFDRPLARLVRSLPETVADGPRKHRLFGERAERVVERDVKEPLMAEEDLSTLVDFDERAAIHAAYGGRWLNEAGLLAHPNHAAVAQFDSLPIARRAAMEISRLARASVDEPPVLTGITDAHGTGKSFEVVVAKVPDHVGPATLTRLPNEPAPVLDQLHPRLLEFVLGDARMPVPAPIKDRPDLAPRILADLELAQ